MIPPQKRQSDMGSRRWNGEFQIATGSLSGPGPSASCRWAKGIKSWQALMPKSGLGASDLGGLSLSLEHRQYIVSDTITSILRNYCSTRILGTIKCAFLLSTVVAGSPPRINHQKTLQLILSLKATSHRNEFSCASAWLSNIVPQEGVMQHRSEPTPCRLYRL
jgi:hypothetical protein